MRSSHDRFEFGKNWRHFISGLNEERITEAEKSLQEMLGIDDLVGRSFLDIGSGSGLFSLAACRLGARRVHSFDFDVESVACTSDLKRTFFPNDEEWTIEQGSVLDLIYLRSLGEFDVVYAWGVLHHTGAMWLALENVQIPLVTNGQLFISIYNKQPYFSTFWSCVKRVYNWMPKIGKVAMNWGGYLFFAGSLFLSDTFLGRNPLNRHRGRGYRGMNLYRDVVDWLGGWPFEVASPNKIFRYYRDAGFVLEGLRTVGGKSGCNQYVFRRVSVHEANR